MIRTREQAMPSADPSWGERGHVQGDVSLCCGKPLDIYVPAGCAVPVSGIVVVRCPQCGTVETPATRAERLDQRLAREARACARLRATVGTTRTCRREGCDVEITGAALYCSHACHNGHQAARAEARRHAHAARKIACARPGCPNTFTPRSRNPSRRYCSRICGTLHQWEQRQGVAA